MDWISANALTTQDEALAYLQRSVPGSDLERCVEAVNHAADMLELLTGRRLAARTYRDTVELSGFAIGSTANSPRLSGGGIGEGAEAVKLYDDAVDIGGGGALRSGSRIIEIPDFDAVILNAPALVTDSDLTVFFGSEPEIQDGPESDRWGNDRSRPIYARETPVIEVFAIKQVQADGTKRTLDLTGIRIERQTGAIWLPNDWLWSGGGTVELHYSAGLRFPSTVWAGDREVHAAQTATHRLAQVNFQDWAGAAGRAVDVSIGSTSKRSDSFRIPSDVELVVEMLKRRM